MKLTNRIYQFTIGKNSRVKNIKCRKCDKKIRIGQEVVGQSGNNIYGKRHHYHKECWDRLFQN